MQANNPTTKEATMLEQKERYTLQELYEELPCTLVELGQKSGLSEVTVARIRDGKPTRRSTVNRLLLALSEIYGVNLSLRNVTGINVQVNKRVKARGQKQDQIAA
jgi:predicted transcriptional regulator